MILLQPFRSDKPVSMENLPVNNRNGQAYGYTLYETTITTGGLLRSGDNVRDRALVSPVGNKLFLIPNSIHIILDVLVVTETNLKPFFMSIEKT